jgi:hypothetical protein
MEHLYSKALMINIGEQLAEGQTNQTTGNLTILVTAHTIAHQKESRRLISLTLSGKYRVLLIATSANLI